jgi:hypothetical protein
MEIVMKTLILVMLTLIISTQPALAKRGIPIDSKINGVPLLARTAQEIYLEKYYREMGKRAPVDERALIACLRNGFAKLVAYDVDSADASTFHGAYNLTFNYPSPILFSSKSLTQYRFPLYRKPQTGSFEILNNIECSN